MSSTPGRALRRVMRLDALWRVGMVTGSRRERVCVSAANRKLWGGERMGLPGPEAGDFDGIVMWSPTPAAALTLAAAGSTIEYTRHCG